MSDTDIHRQQNLASFLDALPQLLRNGACTETADAN
jgi:hypothetical protein